jgi:hypothetical protein
VLVVLADDSHRTLIRACLWGLNSRTSPQHPLVLPTLAKTLERTMLEEALDEVSIACLYAIEIFGEERWHFLVEAAASNGTPTVREDAKKWLTHLEDYRRAEEDDIA